MSNNNNNTIQEDYRKFIYKRTYSRWLPAKERREDWDESIDRYRDYFYPKVPTAMLQDFLDAVVSFREQKLVSAMRSFWTAGPALDSDNIAGFNCAYTPIECPKDFAEVLHILMNGTGVGVSVERQFINKLPEVPNEFCYEPFNHLVVHDSKQGWAEGLEAVLNALFSGEVPMYDLSEIRPAGARLKTFGGRASGPEPLAELFQFVIGTVTNAHGRKLNSEECADITCKVAECVVVGGVRRSAILILTNPSDRRMANFKTGEFWKHNPQRALANISACYTEKPDPITFLSDWLDLMKSGTGERGIVNRESLINMSPDRRDFTDICPGVNPCGEVVWK